MVFIDEVPEPPKKIITVEFGDSTVRVFMQREISNVYLKDRDRRTFQENLSYSGNTVGLAAFKVLLNYILAEEEKKKSVESGSVPFNS